MTLHGDEYVMADVAGLRIVYSRKRGLVRFDEAPACGVCDEEFCRHVKFGAGPVCDHHLRRAESARPRRLPAPIQMGAHHPDDPTPSRTLGSWLRALLSLETK